MGRSLGFRQLGRALLKHNIPTMAAGVTLFILIALFPTVAVLFSLYGKYGDTITLSKGLDQVSAFLPDGGVTLLKAELTRLARGGHRALDWSFLINLMIALWSTSGAYTALAAGLNSAYQLRERRSFMRLTLEGIFFAAIAIGAMIVAAVLLPPSLSAESHSAVLKLLLNLLSWPAAYVSSFVAVALIYRLVPDHPRGRPAFFTPGGGLAALFWILGSVAFTYYVKHFGSYNRTYGELGPAVGFLTWMWFSVVTLLAGAEINRSLDSGTGPRLAEKFARFRMRSGWGSSPR